MKIDKKTEKREHRAWLRDRIACLRAEAARCERAVARRPNSYLPRLAETQHALGQFYWWRHTPASYRMALRQFMQALASYDRYRGRRDLTLGRLTLLNDLAQLSERLDDRSAEEVLLALLPRYEAMAATAPLIYGEDVAETLRRLGDLYAGMQRFDEAEHMYLRSLAESAGFDGEDPQRYRPATAQCRRSLGRLYEAMHDDVRAEACYLDAAAMLRELCDDPEVRSLRLRSLALTLELLADLYERRGVDAEAAAHRSEAVRCRTEAAALKTERR